MAKRPAPPTMEDDWESEYTFGDVFRGIWKRRGTVLIGTLIGLGVGVAAMAFATSRTTAPVSYYIALAGMEIVETDLTERPSSDARLEELDRVALAYPNGTIFQPRDLLDRQVIEEVKGNLKLDPALDLAEGVAVSFDAPVTEGILKKYRDRLAARGLTQADIDTINRNFKQELITANLSGLRIDVNFAHLGVPKEIAVAIAKALPQAWRDVYTQKYRTLVDAGLGVASITLSDEKLDSPSSMIVAEMRLATMSRGLDLINKDNRIAAVLTKNGYSAADLQEDVRRYRAVYFVPLAMASYSKTEPFVAAYVNDLKAQLDAGNRKIDGFDRILRDVLRAQQPSGSVGQSNQGNATVDFGDGSLQQILNLAARASFTLYAQEIFEERQKIVEEVAELEKQIAMATFQTSEMPLVTSPQDPVLAADKLRELTAEYKDLVDKAIERARSVSGQLFVDISSPTADIKRINVQSVATLIVPTAIGAVISLLYLLASGLLGNRNSRT